ncbi:NUDIX hydrolase [Microaerobacter geothermalis]|uniref:NUDIX hydrolase n=1 Tax=Microaerobacter geothermalis TaxID=674972 RepID=UPI001F48B0A3|nr:NUDIX hydrolase [Microaerobacter geothermalis]MCF6093462.1 NUDIX hydrolase [Microaerobacter geothermalis]
MSFEEKTITSRTIYEGRIISLKLDEVEMPDGRISSREIVNHPGAVAIIAITDQDQMVMVKQYRKPLEKTIIEIPAGKLEKGEKPEECALRELQEETGYTAKSLLHIASFYTSPGFADEIIHLFWADQLVKGENAPDDGEFVELVEITWDEAKDLLKSGVIIDAKTILALYVWENYRLKTKGDEKFL